jgi:hypothetical protein
VKAVFVLYCHLVGIKNVIKNCRIVFLFTAAAREKISNFKVLLRIGVE